MNKHFAKLVYTSDDEMVVVYKQEDEGGNWSCNALTRYSHLNCGYDTKTFETHEECHQHYCSFGIAEAEAALKAAKGQFYKYR